MKMDVKNVSKEYKELADEILIGPGEVVSVPPSKKGDVLANEDFEVAKAEEPKKKRASKKK